MNGYIQTVIDRVRSSYWFIPSVMTFVAILLGAAMVWLDAGPGEGLLDGLGWYQSAKPDGAQEVLSTIAGSMITVAGVVFSITIVAIAYAASQYGPRILTNFMSDRGNQVTLGTFLATFVYCLVVLRTIRGGDEGDFVPQLAVMVGLFLALCSIAVLIYFIHHVPRSIHINTVVAHIGSQLIRSVQDQFPSTIGSPAKEETSAQGDALASWATRASTARVQAARVGYIQAIDDEQLMEIACKNNLVLRFERVPGDFVFDGRDLAEVWTEDEVDEKTARAIRAAYTIGSSRTPYHDMTFMVDELVEIAARALSTGVNDPYTAVTCMDWIGAAAAEMARRQTPSRYRVDDEGSVRVIAPAMSFGDFIERGFGRMRQYAAHDMNAALHQLDTLAAVAVHCGGPDMTSLKAEAEALLALAEQELHGPALERVRKRFLELRRLSAPDGRPAVGAGAQ